MNISSFADLLASSGLRLLPGASAVPVDLLVQRPDGTVAHFTARGTTIRLALHVPDALSSLVIAPECGCGKHHDRTGPLRVTLRHGAVPLAEQVVDGAREFGWTGHRAGLLRPAEAVPFFFDLLGRLDLAEPPAELALV